MELSIEVFLSVNEHLFERPICQIQSQETHYHLCSQGILAYQMRWTSKQMITVEYKKNHTKCYKELKD